MTDAPRAVFLSYRREDTRHVAGRLADRLTNRLGPGQVFMDVDTIEPGADFATVKARALAASRILIALIGPTWLAGTDRWGRRRLDDPGDFVVMEIRAALERGRPIIPVLVDGAVMPGRGELPEGLQGLARRNAVPLDHDTFRSDLTSLLTAVDRILSAPAHEAIEPAVDAGTSGAALAVTAAPERRQQAAESANPGVLLAGKQEVAGTQHRSLPASPPAPLAPTLWSHFRPLLIAVVFVLAVVGGSVLLTTNTRSVTATITVGDIPSGVAISPNGRHLYITNYRSGSVSIIDTECWLIGYRVSW